MLGSTQQGAGTFYNSLCSNKALKTALQSVTRPAVAIPAKELSALSAPAHANNGIFFQAARQQFRASQALAPAGFAASTLQNVPAPQPVAHAGSAEIFWDEPPASPPITIHAGIAGTRHEATEIPRVTTVVGTWRAWWCAPFLRHMTGRNGAGSTRMTRYRQAVEYVRCGLSLAYCEKHPEVALDRGWATLAGYLKNVHGVSVHEDGAPSRQVVFIVV